MQQFSARFCFQLILIFFDCCVFSFQSNEVFVPTLFLIYCGCLVYVLVIIVILLVFCIFQVFEVQFLPRPLVIASLKCFFYYPRPHFLVPTREEKHVVALLSAFCACSLQLLLAAFRLLFYRAKKKSQKQKGSTN